jgi:predicted alpha-1,6-mannanase (GH76 family)
MNTADIVFPQREEGERPIQWMRRATQYCQLGTPDTLGDKVKVRPNRGHYNDAVHASVPCTMAYLIKCIQSHKADKQRDERFKFFLKEDGLPEDGIVINEDGSKDHYAPDAMGYPTLVYTEE